ncbi:MAG: hypothetical protein R2684_14760 [Pyrinomonadaceae bacterium]
MFISNQFPCGLPGKFASFPTPLDRSINTTNVRERRFFSISRLSSIFLCVFVFCGALFGQDLPDKIRGYKVQKADVSINGSGKGKAVEVRIGEPEIKSISLTGVEFALPAEMSISDQSGRVDFLSFKGFEVNGIAVEIDEYRDSFNFQRDEKLSLPKPVSIRLGAFGVLKGAMREIRDQKACWRVAGRVFVFGKFKKLGFSFKRVVPVDVDILIPNPTLEKSSSDAESPCVQNG